MTTATTRIPSTNGHSNNGNGKHQEEKPQFQFRGSFLPAEIINLVLERKLCESDLLLLIIVESLVTHRGKGCYAKNQYLADSLRVSYDRIPQIIKKLVGLGHLIVTWEGNRRYLETSWSRAAEKPKELDEKEVVAALQPCNGATNEGCNGATSPTYKGLNNEGSPPKSGYFTPEQIDTPNLTFAKECTNKLYQVIAKNRKLQRTKPNLRIWANEFLDALADDWRTKKEITRALDWYVKHFGEKYAPRAYCAKTFVDSIRKIEDQMDFVSKKDSTVVDDKSW